jgi:NAD(P)-dependent dehydrogenase (short-subunit alcohol dehydrogenase family)
MDHQEQTMNQNHSIPCLLPDPTAAVNDIGHNHQMSNTSHDDATAITKSSSSEKQDVVITVEEIVTPFETTGLSHATAMSQMVILPEDAGVSEDILPPGVSDINGQQLDLRQTNSWLLKMEEVSTPEVIECMFVNAIAPFVLNSRLKPLMTMPQNDSRPDRYIINVSAMEGKVSPRNEGTLELVEFILCFSHTHSSSVIGFKLHFQFYRYKTECHPHTNMAKAALNMLTRTSAENLAKQHRIFMNSVDTGWINDENPLEKASKIAQHNRFQTPIDEIDAAARILDPIFTGIKVGDASSEKMYGQFLKDYRESEW